MKGDFSRVTFDPQKQFSGVRMQQGRVQLDSDWNEQMDILMHRFETEVSDFIGERAVPSSADGGTGFLISAAGPTLSVAPGRYYIRGKLFENASAVTYENQPLDPPEDLPVTDGNYVAYLDAWEQHVSVLEEPSLREVALGGADTTTRIRNVWQARLEPAEAGDTPLTLRSGWQSRQSRELSTVRMQAFLEPGSSLENQLYRVELHAGSQVKWARDNGSVAARMRIVDTTIVLESGTLDTQRGFAAGQTLELLTARQLAAGLPGELIALAAAQGPELLLAAAPQQALNYVAVRRWDGVFPFALSSRFQLENGISVQFGNEGESQVLNSGDYWQISSRAGQQEIVWPAGPDGPALSPPHGVRHFFVPLAFVSRLGGQWSAAADGDLRIQFQPLIGGFVSKLGDSMSGPLRIAGPAAPERALRIDRGTMVIGGIAGNAPANALDIGNFEGDQFVSVTAGGGHKSGIKLFTDGPIFGFRIENDGDLGGFGGLHIRAIDDANEVHVLNIDRKGTVRIDTPVSVARTLGIGLIGGDFSEGQLSISGGQAELSLFQQGVTSSFPAAVGKRFAWRNQGGSLNLATDLRGDLLTIPSAGDDRLQIGRFNESQPADCYISLRASDDRFRTGIRLHTSTEQSGFTIENDSRPESRGLNFMRRTPAVQNGAESALFIDRETGRVGIGTTRPDGPLHVQGDMLLTGAIKNEGAFDNSELVTNRAPDGTIMERRRHILFGHGTGVMSLNRRTFKREEDPGDRAVWLEIADRFGQPLMVVQDGFLQGGRARRGIRVAELEIIDSPDPVLQNAEVPNPGTLWLGPWRVSGTAASLSFQNTVTGQTVSFPPGVA